MDKTQNKLLEILDNFLEKQALKLAAVSVCIYFSLSAAVVHSIAVNEERLALERRAVYESIYRTEAAAKKSLEISNSINAKIDEHISNSKKDNETN